VRKAYLPLPERLRLSTRTRRPTAAGYNRETEVDDRQ